MTTLGGYYLKLLQWEGEPEFSLIATWPLTLRKDIERDFVGAVHSSNIKQARHSITICY